ncbi:MAG: DUF4394 domain-containing protein [Verrucomicrobiales bacterium]
MNSLKPILGLLALTSLPTAGHAALLYGLTSSNQLVSFDSDNPGAVTPIGVISAPGVVDIDVYPVNKLLYGVNAGGSLFRINTTTAAATLVATPSVNIASVTDFDFNPAVDRLRIFSSGSRNFRMVPDVNNSNPGTPGAVTVDGQFSDLSAQLVGSAYKNNFDGVAAATTSLYSIDAVTDSLILHSGGPTFNTLNIVGSLGIPVGGNVGFDIRGLDTAFLSNDSDLYRVNLTTGAATSLGTVGASGLTSIAAAPIPEAGSLAIFALAGGLITCRRREPGRSHS